MRGNAIKALKYFRALVIQSENPINEPIWGRDIGRACRQRRQSAIAQFQQKSAQNFTLQNCRLEIAVDQKIELNFQTGAGLAKVEQNGWDFGCVRLRAFCPVTMLLQSAPKAFGVGPTASPRRVRPAADKMAVLRLRARRSSSFHALMGWALDTIR